MKIKIILFMICCLLEGNCISQNSAPFFFKIQDKQVTKHIRKYLEKDTLIKTSEAIIHVHYSIKKNKPNLVLLHGMGGNGKSNWYNQIKPLSKHFNLIIPDLIYFGESSSSSNDFSVEFQAKQLREVLKQINYADNINMVGFSYGGLTTVMYNEFYPNDVDKIIIIDAPVKFYSSQIADSLAHLAGTDSMHRVIVPTNFKEFKAMKKAVISRVFPVTKRIQTKIINYVFLPTKHLRDKQLNYLIDKQNYYQSLNYNIDSTPTLLLWGKRDGVVPLSVADKINKTYPATTKLVVFKKAKHDAHFRNPKQLNQEIIKFIKE
jgi:pimeloyl-ACP methyl ester carboxylesterase